MREFEEKKAIKGYHNLKRYFGYFAKYKGLCAGFWASLLLTGVASFFRPFLLGKMLSAVTVEQDFELAIHYAVIFAICEAVAVVNSIVRVPFYKKLENYVKRDVKLGVVEDSFHISIGEYENLGNGTFVTRLTGDLDSLAMSFKNVNETIVNFLSRIGFIVSVYVINVWVGLFLTAFIIARYFVYQIRIHYFSMIKPKVLRKAEDINSVVGETVHGIKDIKVLNLGKNLSARIHAMQDEYMKLDNKEWYIGISLIAFSDMIKVACNFFFVLICVNLIQNGRLDLAVFYSLHLYKNNVLEFAVHLGDLQNKFKEMEVNAFRVFQLVDAGAYAHDVFGTDDISDFSGRIEFKNVFFSYRPDDMILNDVNFEVPPHSHIAFVGKSGCGKSTIVSLICHLYCPTEGQILFDGVDSSVLSRDFYRNISMVNQSPYLFDMTIRENMQLVRSDVTDEEIFEALKLANAYDFVKELPDGLDSNLGEDGTRLSGGQKQRICVARALLKNSKVLILDEATSALDNISQELVMESVEKLKQEKTIITIAHRLSTIEKCDKIYFFDGRKIVNSGTHEYLLSHNESYCTLYNEQKKEQEEKTV